VLQLIQLGAPLDLVNEEWGFSALLWACYLGHERIVKALLDGKYEGMGASLIVSDEHREAPLHHASRGHLVIVRLLVARGADVAAESARALSRSFARARLPLRAAASASLALVEAPAARESALRAID
jgi:ankyrin repeat protein